MASLKKIAESCGTSIRTVQRVLKQNGYASADVRARVLAAAADLGYRPNRTARSLRTGRSFRVSVIIGTTDELKMRTVSALEQTLRSAGYAIDLLFAHALDGETGTPCVMDEILDRRPDGVVLMSTLPGGSLLDFTSVVSQEIPAVEIDGSGDLDGVGIDRQQGVYDAVSFLLGEGRERIAYLGRARDSSRLDGYRRALAEAGHSPRIIELLDEDIRDQFAYGKAAARAIDAMAVRPDAVQVYTDVMAMGLLVGLDEAGRRVPDEIAVVGFDDRPASAWSHPALTTVHQPVQDVGRQAAEILLDKIEHPGAPSRPWQISLPTVMVRRDSA